MFQPCYTDAFAAKRSWRLPAISSARLLAGCGRTAAPPCSLIRTICYWLISFRA